MSSGKFCCKSWRKLLVPGTCPTPLLEVNYCFSCTAKTHVPPSQPLQLTAPAPSSAPASSSRQAAPRHRLRSASAPLSSSRHSRGRPHTCSPGSRAHGCRSFPSPLVAFSGLWSSSNKQRCNSLTQRKGHLAALQRQNNAFHSVCLKTCTVHVLWVFFSFSMELM